MNQGGYSNPMRPAPVDDWMGVDSGVQGYGMGVQGSMQQNIYQGDMTELEEDFSNEPPLLEELGIDFKHIIKKTLFTLNPTGTVSQDLLDDADLTGPVLFLFLLSSLLLLSGKIQYGYVFGFGLCGCFLMTLLLNLISTTNSVDLTHTTSILGYGILPLLSLAIVKIFFSLNNIFGFIFTCFVLFWCTFACTRLFEASMNMREQRYIIAYPVLLLFVTFAIITIF
ncbi:hypothetical protein WA158_007829 [Blastocystis sp. Blastoise]